MTQDAYSTDKLVAHQDVLTRLRAGLDTHPISVHLMPTNVCNERCSFCSYRLPDNKNSEAFNEKAHIPLERMFELLADFQGMGVQGIEVTGGGEPLAYPYTEELWAELRDMKFATSLVTNGTLMRDYAPLVCSTRLKWARVSIDCSTAATYTKMRGVPEGHFKLAWRGVEQLREHAPKDPDFRLGVGFVLCNENIDEVYDAVHMAKEHGADNIRLAVTYSDAHQDYYDDPAAVERAIGESLIAEADFTDENFTVHNLMHTRWNEVKHPAQDYRRCPTKDLLCVVEGEGRVYTCCTFTGSLSGLYGVFWEHEKGFKGLWESKAEWRHRFDASKYCKCSCLYRERNLAMNELIDAEEQHPFVPHVHKEFI